MRWFWLAACFYFLSTSNAYSQKKIALGLAFNFTELTENSINAFGSHVRKSASLALKKEESYWKKKGISISLEELDFGSNALKVKEIATKAVNNPDILAVIGYEFSEEALLAAPIHASGKLPLVTPTASADRLNEFPSIYTLTFTNSDQAKVLVQFLKKQFHPKKSLIVTSQDCAYCQDLGKAFEKYLKEASLSFETIPVLNQDVLTNFPTSLQLNSFDLAIVPNHEVASLRVVQALQSRGFDKPIIGGDSWRNLGKLLQDVSSKNMTAYKTSRWAIEFKSPASQQFVNDFKREFQTDPNTMSALTYDATNFVLEGLKKCKEFTREELERNLKKISQFKGVTGEILFNLKDKSSKKSIFLLRSHSDGFKLERVVSPHDY